MNVVTSDSLVLAARLREARLTLGLSQQDVATALGVPRSSVSQLEYGKRRIQGIELARLARLYRRDVAWFLGQEPDPDVDREVHDAITHLSEHDRVQVLRFARFLAAQ